MSQKNSTSPEVERAFYVWGNRMGEARMGAGRMLSKETAMQNELERPWGQRRLSLEAVSF